jgi:hypothetical protein
MLSQQAFLLVEFQRVDLNSHGVFSKSKHAIVTCMNEKLGAVYGGIGL